MSQQAILARVVGALEATGSPYMLTGSIVSSLQGEPRSSHDIDIVVAITPAGADQLTQAFPPPDFHLDPVAVRNAVARRDMFNLLEIATGEKVDFWPLTEDAFDVERFSRRHAQYVGGLKLYVSRPEDTILQKLRWAHISGGSERQFLDALRVFEVQRDNLDLTYMGNWAGRLNVQELWQRLQVEATPL
jgi:hypothetical protein